MIGEQAFGRSVLVLLDDLERSVEDAASTPVVLLENERGCVEFFGHALEVAKLCGSPAIDGLIRVADGSEMFLGTGKKGHELILCGVGVLHFVDQDVADVIDDVLESGER